jgi:hypothetical protein
MWLTLSGFVNQYIDECAKPHLILTRFQPGDSSNKIAPNRFNGLPLP